jgi:predicted DCC family thiol-disulfide oxidoreductase YuxK
MTPQTYYNEKCPVCSAGVAHIRRLVDDKADDFVWCDINRHPQALADHEADVEAIKKRLHVVDRHGVLRVGVPAFAALWDEIPRYRWLASFVRLPVAREVAGGLYELLAAVLYVWNKRHERRADGSGVSPVP